MKRKAFVGLLCIEAAVLLVLNILRVSFSENISAIMAFPFEQIGHGLRFLSLSNDFGNAIAIIIYIILSLLPIAALLILRKKRMSVIEDWLLIILSIVLFAVIYMMINPGSISARPNSIIGQSIEKAALGCTVYSVLCGYIILRLVRLFSVGGADKLIRYMTAMLICLNLFFAYLVFGICFGSLLDSITSLKASNIGSEHLMGTSYVFLVLRFIVDSLPIILDALVVFAALELLKTMQIDRYSDKSTSVAKRLSRLCSIALVTTTLVGIGFNLLQLMFAKSLLMWSVSVQIPLLSVIFMLAALLLTQFIVESKSLKDDNDLFV